MQNAFGKVRRASLGTECKSQGLLDLLKSTKPTNNNADSKLWEEAIGTISEICAKEKLGQPLTEDDRENFIALQKWSANVGKWKRNQNAAKGTNMYKKAASSNALNMDPNASMPPNMSTDIESDPMSRPSSPVSAGGRRKQRKSRKQTSKGRKGGTQRKRKQTRKQTRQ